MAEPGDCCNKLREAMKLNDEASKMNPKTAAELATLPRRMTDAHRRAVTAMVQYVMTDLCPFCHTPRPIREEKPS